MDVNVDETGGNDESAGIEGVVGLAAKFAGGRNFYHAAIFEQEIVLALKMLSGVDEETVADCESSSPHEEPFAADLRFAPKFRAKRGIPMATIGCWATILSLKRMVAIGFPPDCFANCRDKENIMPPPDTSPG